MLPRRTLTRASLALGLAASSALATTGCTARKVAYGFLDSFAYRAVDRSFEVDAAQKAFLKERLAALHAWHATSELPLYVEDLRVLEGRAADGLDRADVDWVYARLEGARARLVDRMLPDTVAFLAMVKPAQVDVLQERNAERNAERAERAGGDARTAIEKRSAALEKSFRAWMGPLTPPQKERVVTFAVAARAMASARLQASRASQAALAQALRSGASPDVLQATVLAGIRPLSPEENPYQATVRDLVVDVAALATPAQKARFVDEVRAWRADFVELAAKWGARKVKVAP